MSYGSSEEVSSSDTAINIPSPLVVSGLSLLYMVKPFGNISALVIFELSQDSVPKITSGLKLWIKFSKSAVLPTMYPVYCEKT